MTSPLNRLSRVLYGAARLTRDARAVSRAVDTGSPAPLVRRAGRKLLGRLIARAVG